MKSREDESMVEAFTTIYSELEVLGHNPKLHILDNECPRAVQNFQKMWNTMRQNVEAHHHNVNAAKPAVKSTKYHLISHVDTVDVNWPIQLWSEMLPQIQETLHMVRTSRDNNKLTAYEEIKSAFD